ncbi:MAG: hypothetical protein JSR46_05385 [Verrucomicrobia bacterium]|nr:hypothetical protein [Verrucomicrobiota bacterium]
MVAPFPASLVLFPVSLGTSSWLCNKLSKSCEVEADKVSPDYLNHKEIAGVIRYLERTYGICANMRVADHLSLPEREPYLI